MYEYMYRKFLGTTLRLFILSLLGGVGLDMYRFSQTNGDNVRTDKYAEWEWSLSPGPGVSMHTWQGRAGCLIHYPAGKIGYVPQDTKAKGSNTSLWDRVECEMTKCTAF